MPSPPNNRSQRFIAACVSSGPFRRAVAVLLLSVTPILAQTIPVVERTLPNGMRVLLVERHEEPTIACGWVARVGSANERPGITGLAHLFEHMMFKGTKTIGTRDAKRDGELNRLQDQVMGDIHQEIDLLREKQRRGEIPDLNDPRVRSPRHQKLLETLEGLVKEQRALIVKDELDKIYKQFGATEMNANTTQDRTLFQIDVPANKLELWAWLESDRIRNAVFREFYSERDVVLEERRQRTDATPTGAAMEAFMATVWKALPYSWPVLGWPSDITHVSRDQADAFFATYYTPSNITVILVGDFKVDEAFATVAKYFGGIPTHPKAVPQMTTLEPLQVAEQRMVAEVESNPMVLAVFKTVPSVHRDAPALDVLAAILNGASGRLERSLIREQKVAVFAGAFSQPQKYGGLFYLMASPPPGLKPEDLEPALFKEIVKIQVSGVSERELQKVKNQAQAAAYTRMENGDQLRDQLAEAESAGSYRDFLEYPEKIQAITREDLQRVAAQYFVPDKRNTLVLHRKTAITASEVPTQAQETKQ